MHYFSYRSFILTGGIVKKLRLLLTAMVAAFLGVLAAPVGASAQTPDEVVVGVFINDVQEVDLENHHYLIDFYLWFRWTNPDLDPTASLEIMNLTESWNLMATPSYEEPLVADDGTLYNVVHYQGRRNNKLPLQKYPLDEQSLIIEFEDNAYNASQVVFVPDQPGAVPNEAMSLPGWNIGTPTIEVADNVYNTTFGKPGAVQGETYSRVTISIPVERPAFTSGIKLFFPLRLVLLTTGLTFLMRPSMIEARIGTAITALLTLVALQLTVNDQLPAVEYLMMIDVIYAWSYLFVLYTMATTVYSAWTANREDSPEAIRFDRHSLYGGLAGYLLLVILTIIGFLA